MSVSRGFTPGAEFVLDAPDHVPALWGSGDEVLWPKGEPLVLAGPPGVGKTTVAQQLTLARCGATPATAVLGFEVEPDLERYTAYVAADRPRQAARSMRRMVKPVQRSLLTSLLVWEGPLPFSVTRDPAELAGWLRLHEVGTVVIDSLKDIAVGLADDQVGAAVGQALQHVAAAGIEVVVLHHQRKGQDGNRKPRSLDDVYGSAWITAGAGSVVLLWGEAGDAVVELRHLKQPAGEVGPLEIVHDHLAGRSTVTEQVTAWDIVRAATDGGVTVAEAAQRLYGATPSREQVEKARRKLDSLVSREWAVKVPGDGPKAPSRYRPVDRRRDALESENGPERDQRDSDRDRSRLSRFGSVEHHAPITEDHGQRSEGTPLRGGPTVNGSANPTELRSSTCTCLRPAASPRANGPAQCAICRRPVAAVIA